MQNKAKKKSLKILKAITGIFFGLALLNIATINAQNYDSNDKQPVRFYFNAGALGDVALKGYDSALVDRDPRVAYQLEVGGEYFAVPVSFSRGQNVDLIGIKPRVQLLYPISDFVFSAGPGIGFVYNYWKSDLGLSGTNFNVTVHEIGFQPSLQVMLRPLPFLNILITPAAFDFNVWRQVNANTGIKGLGNFSTNDETFGIVYSAGASVGVNF